MTNGFDNIAFFAAAVVAGNVANLNTHTLNTLSVAYVASRVVFNIVYVSNWPKLRVVSFFAGIGICFTLFLKASGRFREGLA
jgi:uncharacterized MAPEG superfamily protein